MSRVIRDFASRSSVRDITSQILGDDCFGIRAPLQWHARVA
jgi:hypothetical protein